MKKFVALAVTAAACCQSYGNIKTLAWTASIPITYTGPMTVKVGPDSHAYVLQQVTTMGPAYAQYVDYPSSPTAPSYTTGTIHASGFASAVPTDITVSGSNRVMLCQQSGPNGVLLGGFSSGGTLSWSRLFSPSGSINYYPLGIEAGHVNISVSQPYPYVYAAWASYDTSTYNFTSYTIAKLDPSTGAVQWTVTGPGGTGTSYSPPPCNQTYSATSPPARRVYQQARKIIYVNNNDTVFLVGRQNTSGGPLAFVASWPSSGTGGFEHGYSAGASPNWFNAVDGDGTNAYAGGIGWNGSDFPRTYLGQIPPGAVGSTTLVPPVYSPPYPLNNDEGIGLSYNVDPVTAVSYVHVHSFAEGPNLGAINLYLFSGTSLVSSRIGVIPGGTTSYPGGALMALDLLNWSGTGATHGVDLTGYNTTPLLQGYADSTLADVSNGLLPLSTLRSISGIASDNTSAYPGVFVLSTNTMGNPILLKYN